VRKFIEEGGFFEFEYGGEKKRAQLPVATVVEYELVEFPIEMPNELFEVPRDVPVEETVMDKLWEWLEGWLTDEDVHKEDTVEPGTVRRSNLLRFSSLSIRSREPHGGLVCSHCFPIC